MVNPKFLISATGIFVCFFFFGILQEKVTKAQYITENGEIEKFTYAISLVLFLCTVNLLFAIILSWNTIEVDTTKTSYYCLCALTYILAMVCTNMSLQFVSYPTQVVAKASKPIPVLVLGVLLGRKSYSWRKYFNVLLVVIGVALFMYKDKKSTSDNDGVGFGELLLILSLIMDGLNGAIQERMKQEHQTKSIPMMLNMNLWASMYLLITVIFTGEIFAFIPFVQRHPDILWKMLILSAAGASGQFFIFMSIAEFGPLPTSIVATVRKFFTVLASVIFLGNSLLVRQWLATVIVFSGLFLDILYAVNRYKEPRRRRKPSKRVNPIDPSLAALS